ncbi:unnamed protein product [Enterobius vermicularis]|uniref:Secreted protein n=1 Tax=Enterobius vermicularis TaxID=51028 RepID=A0A0N4VBV9_ENTVE|nr:unnamed protein product [Enterobius vermicularis]
MIMMMMMMKMMMIMMILLIQERYATATAPLTTVTENDSSCQPQAIASIGRSNQQLLFFPHLSVWLNISVVDILGGGCSGSGCTRFLVALPSAFSDELWLWQVQFSVNKHSIRLGSVEFGSVRFDSSAQTTDSK